MLPTHRTDESAETDTTRRELLGAVGSGLAATAGCVSRLSGSVGRDSASHVSLSIKTAPTDTDPRAIRIARALSSALERVGIETTITPMSRAALRRDVLLNHSFDCYVARYPGHDDPGFLRPLFHSRYNVESGWQNPFGYTDIETDHLLTAQRQQQGARRRATLRDAQLAVARDQPLSVVAFPEERRLCRTDRYAGWSDGAVHTPLGYLSLHERGDDDPSATRRLRPGSGRSTDGESTLTMTTTDERLTQNLNPLSVEYRRDGTVTGLLYDPLARRIDGAARPWLASGWEWVEPEHSPRPTAEVTLRPELTWHDDTSLSADDVAFTYRLLRDTSLGAFESPVPAPRFRGASSLVDRVEYVDERTVRVAFVPSSHAAAAHALTVPILPEHVWRERTKPVSVPWVEEGSVSAAVVAANLDPVGSGPFGVERVRNDGELVLATRDDHFLDREGLASHLDPYAGTPPFERLTFSVVPATDTAVELVLDGEADGTATPPMPADLPKQPSGALETHVDEPNAFYHVGFNGRRAPTGNPRFRRAVARLVDEEHLVEAAFDGAASPAASPLARSDALAPELEWDGEDPILPYPGEAGELDEAAAKELFKRAGYRYDDDGTLLM